MPTPAIRGTLSSCHFLSPWVFSCFFLWKEPSHRNEKLGILAAFSCLAIAVIQDYIEGTTEGYDWFEINYGMDSSAILHFAKLLEESLELISVARRFLQSSIWLWRLCLPHGYPGPICPVERFVRRPGGNAYFLAR